MTWRDVTEVSKEGLRGVETMISMSPKVGLHGASIGERRGCSVCAESPMSVRVLACRFLVTVGVWEGVDRVC